MKSGDQIPEGTVRQIREVIMKNIKNGRMHVQPAVEELATLYASLIDEQIQAARLDERRQVALDNYRGQTFSDSTNWRGKYEKFIENNERRIAQLSPKPIEREQ